jgi:hypothetical protein
MQMNFGLFEDGVASDRADFSAVGAASSLSSSRSASYGVILP